MNKQDYMITVSCLIIIILSGYIVYDTYLEIQDKQSLEIQNATLNCYNLARSEIISIAASCKQNPITFKANINETTQQEYVVTLVALECLQGERR